jgi:hypothetical protein
MTHFALALILALSAQIEPPTLIWNGGPCPGHAGVCISIEPQWACPDKTVMLTFEDGKKWCRKVYR